MIENDLATWLEGRPAVSAIVGARIYFVRLPDKATLPAITIQRVSGARLTAHSGRTKHASPIFQVNCWGKTYKAAKELAKVLQQELEGFKGTMGSTDVQATMLIGDRDDFHPEVDDYRAILEFRIWHTEL